MLVTVDEMGREREEPVPCKAKELKMAMREKRSQVSNERKSDKEKILKELRDKKQKGSSVG
jgi:hypothetical protein